MLREFRDFAMKGNVLDLAIGVIIGGAFGKIVSSLVGDVLMPLIGVLLQGVNLTNLTFSLGDATVKYGVFLQSVIDFVIIAFCVFIIVKNMNRFKKPTPVAAPVVPEDILLLREIRDAVKK